MMMIKKGDIVYHKGLLERRGINNNCEFKVNKVENDKAEVEIVVPAEDPFDRVGMKWTKIPIENLIKVRDYNQSEVKEFDMEGF